MFKMKARGFGAQGFAAFETERLLMHMPAEHLAAGTAAFYRRNEAFLAPFEPDRPRSFFTAGYQQTDLAADRLAAQNGASLRLWLTLKPQGQSTLNDGETYRAVQLPADYFEGGKGGEIIGMVGLNSIVYGTFCSCFLAYKVDERYRGQGLIPEGVKAISEIAFTQMGLHRIEANIMPRNAPSLRVVEKLGFENEGLSRSYLKINGVWEDHLHMVLLNPHDA